MINDSLKKQIIDVLLLLGRMGNLEIRRTNAINWKTNFQTADLSKYPILSAISGIARQNTWGRVPALRVSIYFA